MRPLDRLSSLVQNFEMECSLNRPRHDQNLRIFSDGTDPAWLDFAPAGYEDRASYNEPGPLVAAAHVDIGIDTNPLVSALPSLVRIDLKKNPDTAAIARLFVNETVNPRCGADTVISRLAELLVIHLLRQAIERNETRPGLLAGLAHPRLSPVIVAIHDRPQRDWSIEDFTDLAGMSRSRFMEEFQTVMAETPMSYLKRWRMTLAHAALLRGGRVSEIARRFGYSGSDAFSRAFSKIHGMAPSKVRSKVEI